MLSLEVERSASSSGDGSLNVGRSEKSVLVWDRLQGAGLDGVGAGAEVDVVDGCEADGLGVGGLDGLGNAGECGGLDEHLGADAGVEAGGGGLGVLAKERNVSHAVVRAGGGGGGDLLEDVGSSETD